MHETLHPTGAWIDRDTLIASVKFIARHAVSLTAVFLLTALVPDLILATVHLGTLHHGFHPEESLPYGDAAGSSPGPLLFVLLLLLPILTAGFVLVIGAIRQCETSGRLSPKPLFVFVRDRFTSGLRGFWSGTWRAILVMAAVLALGTLAINIVADTGSATLRDILPMLALIGGVAIALPSILATFRCVLEDESFPVALDEMQKRIEGRRKRMLLTLGVSALPFLLTAPVAGDTPFTATLLLVLNALFSILPTIVLYRYAAAGRGV